MNRLNIPFRISLFTAAGLTLLAAVSLGASPAAHAAQIRLMRVEVGDLDVATPAGRRAFDRRIEVAINAVCVQPNRGLPRSRVVLEGIDACRAAALVSVRHQLAGLGIRPALQAVHGR